MLRAWLAAFVFTQLVEVPIYVRFLRCGALTAFGASALTHPIIWFGLFQARVPGTYLEKAIAAELFAWLAEAGYFRWRLGPGRRALVWAACANGASLGLGLLSRRLFGAP